jgi:putative effector of murein hydrolase LrgA (UPF0299 family)
MEMDEKDKQIEYLKEELRKCNPPKRLRKQSFLFLVFSGMSYIISFLFKFNLMHPVLSLLIFFCSLGFYILAILILKEKQNV